MSSAGKRVSRSYTRARHLPWVLGKIGDWTLPLGPYNAAQLLIAFVGSFVLIKTFGLWSWMGPLPPLTLGVAVWAARRTRVYGRSPLYVAWGLVSYALQPKEGRMHGRPVRPARARVLHGGFHLLDTATAGVGAPSGDAPVSRPARTVRPPLRTGRRQGAASRSTAPVTGAAPAPTALQQLLARQEAVRISSSLSNSDDRRP
ncbi:hypothetical protein JW613_33465 [Streptomyces smyrnaeus]|uniref:Conjugal transfer protein n=1 Tax=Streptomyces smyrnaeus TaxID=1387713 RepID=A0ABS3Y7M6_9ACTN|nr:hypothetical protein [Streptomyces smyrnaeus]